MNDIKLKIIWHKDEPIAFWFNEKLIWETDKSIDAIDFPETKISLPLASAIKLSSIFLQGLTADRLTTLLVVLQMKIDELKKLGVDSCRNCGYNPWEKVDKPIEIEAKPADDFYCDKECNRSCADWDKCNTDDADFEDEDED